MAEQKRRQSVNMMPESVYIHEDEDPMDRMDFVRDMIKDNIEYDILIHDLGEHIRERLDELVEIMVEYCVIEGETVIGGQQIPNACFKSRFEKFNNDTMRYVLECLDSTTTEIKNVKKYLLITLYNAPITIGNHISLQVQHGMTG